MSKTIKAAPGVAEDKVLADVAAGINAYRRINPDADARYGVCWKCGCKHSVHDEGSGLALGLVPGENTALVFPHCKDHAEFPPENGTVFVHNRAELSLTKAVLRDMNTAIIRNAIREMREAGVREHIVRATHTLSVTSGFPDGIGVLIVLPKGKNRKPKLTPIPYPWRPEERPGAWGSRGDAVDFARMKAAGMSMTLLAPCGPNGARLTIMDL